MRVVLAALVALFVFAPAAQAQVAFTGVPASPTNRVTFDVGFAAPGAVRYDGVTTQNSVAFDVDQEPPPAPVIVSPSEGAQLNQATVTISGTTAAQTTVAVLDGATKLGDAQVQGETWSFDAGNLADGPHTLTAIATDAAGNPSPASDPRVITVDTVVPQVTIGGVPPSPTNRFTFDVDFSASERVVFDCVHVFPDGHEDEFRDCEPPFELRELTDGTHELRVTATDPAGNAQTKSVSFTIDTEAPAAVEPTQTGESEFTFAGEAGATFECSVDHAGFAPCTSPRQLSGLGPGEHSFAVQAVDAAGNRSAPTTKAFSIAPPPPVVTPVATPDATPAPTPTAVAAAPAAELGRTLVARTVSGKVYVRRPATTALLDLGTVAGIPVGTEIDARKGRVRLTAAATRGQAAHRAEFFGGVFVASQGVDDVVDLRLSEPFGSCTKKTGTRLRKLWGDGKGRFRMHGLNAIVTVRGTRWLLQDSCEGTLTRVTQGLVSVRDTVKRRTVLVRAGRKYLAVPKKRK